MSRSFVVLAATPFLVFAGLVACGDDSSSSGPPATSTPGLDASSTPTAPNPPPASTDAGSDGAVEAGKVLPDGLLEPIPYLSLADNPFNGVVFPSYRHFEDWEDDTLSTPGVTADSEQLGTAFGVSLVDSIDGDDGTIDGKCSKDGGHCNSAFAGGTISFTFDAAALGNLPTHVGIAWTDGSPGCNAVFEAYDASDVLIGTKTATGVGDADNSGGADEDRYFGVVHTAGVKKITVKSSAGGVEVDHLLYGR